MEQSWSGYGGTTEVRLPTAYGNDGVHHNADATMVISHSTLVQKHRYPIRYHSSTMALELTSYRSMYSLTIASGTSYTMNKWLKPDQCCIAEPGDLIQTVQQELTP